MPDDRRNLRTAVRISMVLALLCAPAASAAQTVIGKVIDASTSEPIKFAAVELVNDRDQVMVRASADSTGVFRIRSWHAGKYLLRTRALGYTTVPSQLLELATGDVVQLTVKLAPDAVPLDPIEITARARASLAEIAMSGYYDRRDAGKRLGLGRFVDRGAMAGKGSRLTEVLATIPGVRILRVQSCPVPLITMAGNNSSKFEEQEVDQLVRIPVPSDSCKPSHVCRANVYVDGVQMAFDEVTSIDHTVPLDWVEAIEVYRRASEIPAEYLSRANCGVVAVWTRRG